MNVLRRRNVNLGLSALCAGVVLLIQGCTTTKETAKKDPVSEPAVVAAAPVVEPAVVYDAPPAPVVEQPTTGNWNAGGADAAITTMAPAEPVKPVMAPAGLPSYTKEQTLRGRLRSIGSDTLDNVMASWEKEFKKHHPGMMVLHEGKGSSTACPALTEGRADFGPMSRGVKDSEVAKFKAKFGYDPLALRVAIDALAVYVHPSNPIAERGLSFDELDAIFSSTRKRGHSDIATWGDLGLTGEWANAPINVYSRNSASGTYAFFKSKVLKKGTYKATNKELADSKAVVASVVNDKYGIGYSGIGYKVPAVATAKLCEAKGGTVYPAEDKYAYSGQYPLARFLYLTINHKPGGVLTPLHREFLNFVYSAEGQRIVKEESFYPISPEIAKEELSKVRGAALPSYSKDSTLRGRLRSIGSDTMDNVMASWEKEFKKHHPGMMVLHEGKGSSTACPALTEGRADFGPMSRGIKDSEVAKFKAKFGYDPTDFRVAIDALAVYVHPSNPIAERGLSFDELDGIFSSSRKRGGSDIKTWGDLGLTGEWANAPITVYSRNSASGTYSFFKSKVLKKGSYKATNKELADSKAVVASVANDKYGIGYSGIGYKTPDVATAKLCEKKGDTVYPAQAKYAYSGQYPLARFLYLAINHEPGGVLKPLHREFLKFVFSAEGQRIVSEESFYPISPEIAETELKKVGLSL